MLRKDIRYTESAMQTIRTKVTIGLQNGSAFLTSPVGENVAFPFTRASRAA